MRKALTILGGITLTVIILIAVLYFSAIIQKPGFDSSSKLYIENNIPPIFSRWSVVEIRKNSSPQLLKIINDNPDQFEEFIKSASKIGRLKKLGDMKGGAGIFYNIRNGETVTANYEVGAEFENGDAHITIGLIKISGEWKLVSFHLDSPFFEK
jgi:hypothetical protein